MRSEASLKLQESSLDPQEATATKGGNEGLVSPGRAPRRRAADSRSYSWVQHTRRVRGVSNGSLS